MRTQYSPLRAPFYAVAVIGSGLMTTIACLIGCGGTSPVQTVAIPTTPSTPSIPISTATNPAVAAKTLYLSTGGTIAGIYEFAANANGNVNPTAFIGAISVGDAVEPIAATTDANGNLYELTEQAGVFLGLPAGVYNLMCEYSPSGTPRGNCTNLGEGSPGGSIAVDNKSGGIFVMGYNGTIVEFGPTTTTFPALNILYGTSGAPVGIALAVDGSGNLYAAASTGSNKTSSVFMFPAGSTGATIPTQVIPSAYSPRGLALDPSGNLYISQFAGTSSGAPAAGIYEFAAGSTTNSTPIRSISGTATTIFTATDDFYMPIAVDAADNVFLFNAAGFGLSGSIVVFSSTANGNVAPASTISSTSFAYASTLWLE